MSTIPQRYQPDTRLVDDPDRLERLYCEQDLSIREIADQHAQMQRTAVSEALDEYGLLDDEQDEQHQSDHQSTEDGDDATWTDW